MQFDRQNHLIALLASVALHALVFALAGNHSLRFTSGPDLPNAEEKIIYL
jgi:hypothetical protein